MKKFDKIYVDMDGVIADFDRQFEELIGSPSREYEAQYGTEAFWDAILEYRDFFLTIKPFEYVYQLLMLCRDMSDNVVILSSPSKYNTSICVEQKRKWLDNHGLETMPATFEKEKHKFARPNCLLIDDWGDNIRKWKSAGGEVHHFKGIDGFLEFHRNWRDNGN